MTNLQQAATNQHRRRSELRGSAALRAWLRSDTRLVQSGSMHCTIACGGSVYASACWAGFSELLGSRPRTDKDSGSTALYRAWECRRKLLGMVGGNHTLAGLGAPTCAAGARQNPTGVKKMDSPPRSTPPPQPVVRQPISSSPPLLLLLLIPPSSPPPSPLLL